VLRVFPVIGHERVGLDDVGEGGAGVVETGFDVLAERFAPKLFVKLESSLPVIVAGGWSEETWWRACSRPALAAASRAGGC